MKRSFPSPTRIHPVHRRTGADTPDTAATRTIVPFDRMETGRRRRDFASLAIGAVFLAAVSFAPTLASSAFAGSKDSGSTPAISDGRVRSDAGRVRTTPAAELVLGSRSSRRDAEPSAPVVTARAAHGIVVVEWTPVDDPRVVGYKVVATPGDTAPEYPVDGYLFWIAEPDRTSVDVTGEDVYRGAGIDVPFQGGRAYWFHVAAVYEIGGSWTEIPGNPVRVEYPLPAA